MPSYPKVYYPLGVVIPDYVPNEWNTISILAVFGVACALAIGAAVTIAYTLNPRIKGINVAKVMWFSACGPIHLFLEGYYASHWATLQSSQHPLAQMWKEYGQADSRYLTYDSFVMPMESITAWFWGPLSFLQAYFTMIDHPSRHPLQIIISLGQLYGDVLYFGTCAFEFYVRGIEFSRPEALYFWGYFIFMNAIWIVIPAFLIYDSVKACANAFAEVERTKKHATNGINGVNGSAKKHL